MQTDKILKRTTVLYVEDCEATRTYIGMLLKQICKNVYMAANTEEGLELFKTKLPNIVISDIELEGSNGLDAIEKIRKQNSKIPIIITSQHKEEPILLRAVELFLASYIVKPINFDNLFAGLKKCASIIADEGLLEVELDKNVFYNLSEKSVYINGLPVALQNKELQVLDLLLSKKNSVVDYKTIENIVWSGEGMSESALKNVIFKLRKKLGKNCIHNVENMGYKIII